MTSRKQPNCFLKQAFLKESVARCSGHLFSFLCQNDFHVPPETWEFLTKPADGSSGLLLGVEQEWIRPDPCICQRVATLSCILDNSSCHPAYYEWVKLPTEWMATFLHNSQMTRAAKMIQGKSLSMSHNISPSRTKWMGSDGKMNESLHS